jgi:squalene-hopene/tetraprenyl-beta-curcumene cyclase
MALEPSMDAVTKACQAKRPRGFHLNESPAEARCCYLIQRKPSMTIQDCHPVRTTFLSAILAALTGSSAGWAASGAERPAYQYHSPGISVPAATADEPKVGIFGPESIRAARKYLDDGAHHWVREKSCVACHSTGVYMAERPALTDLLGPPSEEVLQDFIDSIPDKIGKPRLQNGVKYFGASIQSVWRSLGLATWDRHVSGKLSEHTDKSLRHTLQCLADEGFIRTFSQVEIPYITTDFQLTVQAARAMATAPGWLESVRDADTLERLNRIKAWLRAHEPISDYELALKLQLATHMPELVPGPQRKSAITMLWRRQLPDGGWSTRRMSDLMKWHEKMDTKVVKMIRGEPDAADPGSDPFMTAYAVVLLREAGVAKEDPRIRKAIAWLKKNQRVSGRWWMKSLFRDTYHYITYISTAVALQALALCDELPRISPPPAAN